MSEQLARGGQGSIFADIAAGGEEATRRLIERYGGLVWQVALSYSGSDPDVEDAVQEILLDLWSSAGRYDVTRGVSEASFVAMVAKRRMIDRYRKQSRQTLALGEQVDIYDDLAAAGSSLPADVDHLTTLLERLTSEQERVLRLAFYASMSQSQISESLDIPLGTVKSHYRRGLARLRELLTTESST